LIKGIRRFAILIVLTASLTACVDIGPTHLSRDDVRGEWSGEGPDGQRVDAVFERDGTFRIQGAPRVAFGSFQDGPVDWDDVVEASGSWSVVSTSADVYPMVELILDPPRPTTVAIMYLHATGSDSSPRLYFAFAADDGLELELIKTG